MKNLASTLEQQQQQLLIYKSMFGQNFYLFLSAAIFSSKDLKLHVI